MLFKFAVLKKNLKVAVIFAATFFIFFTGKPHAVLADSHDIRGCVTILDDREYEAVSEPSPTWGEYVPIVNVPIPVYIIDALGFNTHVGDLTTNSSGCFSGTVTGIGVPEDTIITVQMELENAEYRVMDDAGTWLYELDKKSVSKSGTADFGTFYGGSTSNGAAMMWVSEHDAVDLHDERFGIGAWASRGYQQLAVKYPLDDDVSNANSSRVAITEGARDDLNTFLHEIGHWIGKNDASSSNASGSYCQSYTGSAYPDTETPYIFIDPEEGSGDCHWHSTTYEDEKMVFGESHANLIREVLWRGECPEDYEDVELNFDDEHTVHNVGRALCDLVDSGKEAVGALHSYGDKGMISVAALSVDLLPAGHLSGSTAYGTDGAKIYAVDFASGALKEVYDMTSTGDTVNVVSSDGKNLCATTFYSLYCMPISGTMPMFKETLPSDMLYVKDIIISGSKVYLAGRVSDDFKVYVGDVKTVGATVKKMKSAVMPHVSLENWKEIYTEPFVDDDSEPKHIALNAAKTRLYIARSDRVETCSLSSPFAVVLPTLSKLKTASATSASVPMCTTGTTADFAGSRSYAGYQRGSPTDSYFDNITQLEASGGSLYIVDTYGVAKIDLSMPTTLEQYIGAGADKVFLNNLSPRSLYFTPGGGSYFALSGKRALFQAAYAIGWDNARNHDTTFHGMYLVDESKSLYQEYYCGEENMEKKARNVVHAFTGHAYGVSFSDFLTVNMGLASGEIEAIGSVSWTKPKSCQSADISGTEITEDLTGSETDSSTTTTKKPKKKHTSETVPCGAPSNDEQLPSAGTNRKATPFESLVSDGTEKLSVPPSYDIPTPLEKN